MQGPRSNAVGRRRLRLALLLLPLLSACGGGGAAAPAPAQGGGPLPPPPPPPPTVVAGADLLVRFQDVTAAVGISAIHRSAPFPDSYWATGQAFGDVDGDGWLDLYVTDSDGPNVLYRNQGDGTFAPSPYDAQVRLATHKSGGAVFADYDNDGWKDLLVLGIRGSVLFRNLAGQGFEDVTAAAGVAGVPDEGQGITGSWADFDNDGLLDLFICNYRCRSCAVGPDRDVGYDRLYRQRADHTFEDVSDLLGLVERSGDGFTGSWLDYDHDGDLDLYVLNDRGLDGAPDAEPLQRNVLWRNDGPDGASWRFTDVTASSGADVRAFAMGLAIGDYDNDGNLDMAYTNIGPLRLLRGLPGGMFESAATAAGVDFDWTHWGTAFSDFNCDGWLDLFVALTDHGNLMYLNEMDGTFRDVSAACGADDAGRGMGCAVADFDRDGWMDLVVGNYEQSYRLYRCTGTADPAVAQPHWLSVRLEGAGPVNRDAVGARVTITRSDGQVQMQEVKCGSSLGAGNDLALHFGLGDATVASLRVRWPDGTVRTTNDPTVDRELKITYPGP